MASSSKKSAAKGAPKRAAKGAVKPAAQPANGAAKSAKGALASSLVGFELGDLRQLIDLVQDTGIGEIELNSNGRSVRISASGAGAGSWVAAPASHAPLAARSPAPAAVVAPAPEPAALDKAVTSPMVGTFYRSPAPDAEPFVEVGDIVEIGQTVCIIEAMKLMNEIEAEVKGRVTKILVENSQAVEFGQKLFLVEPI